MRALVLLGVSIAIIVAFFLIVRPWYLRWGATDDEMISHCAQFSGSG